MKTILLLASISALTFVARPHAQPAEVWVQLSESNKAFNDAACALRAKPILAKDGSTIVRLIGYSGWSDVVISVVVPENSALPARAEVKFRPKGGELRLEAQLLSEEMRSELLKSVRSCQAFQTPLTDNTEKGIDTESFFVEVRTTRTYQWFFREGVDPQRDFTELVRVLNSAAFKILQLPRDR